TRAAPRRGRRTRTGRERCPELPKLCAGRGDERRHARARARSDCENSRALEPVKTALRHRGSTIPHGSGAAGRELVGAPAHGDNAGGGSMPAVALAFALSMLPQEPAPKVDNPAPPVTLTLRCSNAVLEAAAALAEEYRKQVPGVSIAVCGGGSGVALSALADGNADLAITTRPIQRAERARALDHAIEPSEQVIAIEQLAIVVHKDNPAASLTMAEWIAIWSAEGATTQWSQLGVRCPDREHDRIHVGSLQALSAGGEFFRTIVLGKNNLRPDAITAESSAAAGAAV